MADGRKHSFSFCILSHTHTHTHTQRYTNKSWLHLVNQARALRVAEIINDFRTLLLHICEQTIPASPEEYYEEGHVVIRECHTAAQALIGANYTPAAVSSQVSNEEAEKAELQRYVFPKPLCARAEKEKRLTDSIRFRVILDSSARRFQAHRIYLRIAASKRWALHRANILRGQQSTAQQSAQLAAVSNTFQQVSYLCLIPNIYIGGC